MLNADLLLMSPEASILRLLALLSNHPREIPLSPSEAPATVLGKFMANETKALDLGQEIFFLSDRLRVENVSAFATHPTGAEVQLVARQ